MDRGECGSKVIDVATSTGRNLDALGLTLPPSDGNATFNIPAVRCGERRGERAGRARGGKGSREIRREGKRGKEEGRREEEKTIETEAANSDFENKKLKKKRQTLYRKPSGLLVDPGRTRRESGALWTLLVLRGAR